MAVTAIVAPPPTPNGGFHVGHFTGPYLAADIYKRYLKQQNVNAVYVISTDDNQSYVDTTAARRGIERSKLVRSARLEIEEAIALMSLNIDLFGEQGTDYQSYVSEFFKSLIDNELLVVKEVDVLYDPTSKKYPFESFVNGSCPNCLDRCCGGVCESCGHPNDPVDLAKDNKGYRVVKERRLVLEMKSIEEELFRALKGRLARIPLQRLVNELKTSGLKDVVLSYIADAGVAVPSAELSGQKINVWAEMYIGHFYFLEKQLGSKVTAIDEYYQFLGFDNSFFYVILHEALRLLALKSGYTLPTVKTFYTNQFANLGYRKFSSSKNHAIWIADLAKESNTDLLRLYLAKVAPEHQEVDFSLEAFRQFEEVYIKRFNNIVSLHNEKINEPGNGVIDVELAECFISTYWRTMAEGFSITEMAKRTIILIDRLEEMLVSDREFIMQSVPWILYNLSYLFCPVYAQRLASVWDFEIIRRCEDALNSQSNLLPHF